MGLTRHVVVIAAVLGAAHGAARAQSPRLAQARQALDAVRYDEAQTRLVEALRDGGNPPAAVAEIYRLSASTALVLGRRDVAEQYYRRWLAIDPDAMLSADVAPKLREPFIAAQAYIAAHGRLSVKLSARVAPGGARTVEVVVEADPLAMVAAVALADGGVLAPVTLDAERRARLDGAGRVVVVLDEHGNRLVELPVADAAAAPAPAPSGPVVPAAGPPPPAPRATSAPGLAMTTTTATPPTTRIALVRRPITWGISAGVLGVVGLGFARAASAADDDLTAIIEGSDQHRFTDADAARARRDRDAVIANVMFATAGVCAAAAIVLHVTRRQPARTLVAPAADGTLGLSVSRAW